MVVLFIESLSQNIDIHFYRNWWEVGVFDVVSDAISKFWSEFIALAKFVKLFSKILAKLIICEFILWELIPSIFIEIKLPWWKINFLVLLLLKMNSWSCSSSWLKIFSIFFSLKASKIGIWIEILKICKFCNFNHLALIETFNEEVFLKNLIFLHPNNALFVLSLRNEKSSCQDRINR